MAKNRTWYGLAALLVMTGCTAPGGLGGAPEDDTPSAGTSGGGAGHLAGSGGHGGGAGGLDARAALPSDAADDVESAPAYDGGTRPDEGSVPDVAARARDAASPDSAPAPDGSSPPVVSDAGDYGTVFDVTKVHDVQITIEAKYLIDGNEIPHDKRVPCKFVFDGVELDNVGVRQKGGGVKPWFKLGQKPSLSIKFDEFVPKQGFRGFDKLILNNAYQDLSFLSEHMSYEVYRRAGAPAPLTAHGVLTINGKREGIIIVEEATEKQFLRRNFGKDDNEGNLYDAPPGVDWALEPGKMELKDADSGRKNDDILAAAKVVREASDATFVAAASAKVDLDQMILAYALDAALNDIDDGFVSHYAAPEGPWVNNYLIYHQPKTDKFVVLPHGMDFCLQHSAPVNQDPYKNPGARLAQRIRAIPALNTKFKAAVARVGSTIWDVGALLARIDQVTTTIHDTTPYKTDKKVMDDVSRYDRNLDATRSFFMGRKAYLR